MGNPIIDTLADTLSYVQTVPDYVVESASPYRPWLPWIIWLVVLVIRVVIGAWGYNMGKRKGLGGLGLFLGTFLGVIGILILKAVPPRIETTICERCQKNIPKDSNLCPYCGIPLDHSKKGRR